MKDVISNKEFVMEETIETTDIKTEVVMLAAAFAVGAATAVAVQKVRTRLKLRKWLKENDV
jgi:hypothetical protein